MLSLKTGLDKILGKQYYISYSSLFDQSVEGLSSYSGKIKSVQFHPEANPGPYDALDFFEECHRYLKDRSPSSKKVEKLHEPLSLKQLEDIKTCEYSKILVVGSGPIKIGQASEFDYSGTQACRALASLGTKVVLLNSNPATIMTDKELSFKTYIEPITVSTIKKYHRARKG